MKSPCAATVSILLLLCLTPLPSHICEAKPPDRPLRIGMYAPPTGMDPHFNYTFADVTLQRNFYSSLVRMDPAGHAIADLAVRWEMVSKTLWLFELRQGVLFHNGTPLTSADVVASVLRVRNNDKSFLFAMLENIKTVNAEGPNTVRFELSKPDAIFLLKMSVLYIVPKDSPEKITKPIGTGPYEVVDLKLDSFIRMRAFAGYWGEKPKEGEVETVVESDQVKGSERLKADDLDLLTLLRPQVARALEKDDTLWVDSALGSSVNVLILNANIPPFNDPLLREAADYALDRQAIAHDVYLQYARPAGQFVTSQIPGYATGIEPIQQNLVRAKVAMQAAAPEGNVPFTFEYRAGNEELARMIKAQLETVGFRVELKPLTWPELLPRILAGKAQATMWGWVALPPEAGITWNRLVRTGSAMAPQVGSSAPEIDKLIAACDIELDPVARQMILQNIAERVAARHVLLPLVWLMDLHGSRRSLSWVPMATGEINISRMARRKM